MPARRVLLALAMVCAANLLLEVALTRIFSALMFYHFTFLAIAVALLGMGGSGVWVYVSGRFTAATAEADMARAARRFAAATLVVLIYVLANPIQAHVGLGEAPRFTNISFFQLALLCGVTVLPFFFAGMVVSLAITHFRAHVDRVYTWDLGGAGLAALLVGVAIRMLGGPALVVAVALLAAAAAMLLVPGRQNGLALGAVAVLFVAALTTGLFDPPGTKSLRSERVVFDEWNTFSHITVEKEGEDAYAIRIDAAARTPIAHQRDTSSSTWFQDITALGYTIPATRPRHALVIGPGGGIDVARALASGVARVTAVEINPLIADAIMRGRFEAASGGLYRDPRITLVVDEGRSFIRRTAARYDVIQLSMVDTWAATASGAFALTENTLYTLEAFQDYYDHLADDGLLTMTRWWTYLSGPEAMRLAILAAGALETRGVRPGDTRKHLFLATHDNFATLLVKKTPFTAAELARLESDCVSLGHAIELSPTTSTVPELAEMIDAGAWSARVRAHKKDLSPPTDDRPFFFYFNKGLALGGNRTSNPAIWLLTALCAVLVVMTAAFVFLPLALRRWSDLRAGGEPGGVRRRVLGLAYFAAIGFAFMVVEIALMQRLSLFLGHPSYSLVVVLFAILVGTAAGARASSRLAARPGLGVAIGGAVVAVLAVAAGVVLADVVRDLITISLSARMAVSAAIVLVFGLAMGLMLPLGVRLLAQHDAAIIPWAWGINGGMSVIGTVGATVIAINAGFGVTFHIGGALYAAAGGLGLLLDHAVRARSKNC
jgi:spermidine synthase